MKRPKKIKHCKEELKIITGQFSKDIITYKNGKEKVLV
jgi:hypothetical protein